MKLIFLHGPPASGKYSIAQELNESWGVLNFHNHLTIDVAKALFEFGSPEFWDLTHRLRRLALGVDPQRESMRKQNTIAGLEDFLTRWKCVPLARSNCITVSTDGKSVAECAEEIAGRLSLNRQEAAIQEGIPAVAVGLVGSRLWRSVRILAAQQNSIPLGGSAEGFCDPLLVADNVAEAAGVISNLND